MGMHILSIIYIKYMQRHHLPFLRICPSTFIYDISHPKNNKGRDVSHSHADFLWKQCAYIIIPSAPGPMSPGQGTFAHVFLLTTSHLL
jgi:hypothetical protein